MQKFENGQRVVVTETPNVLTGKTGTVKRIRRADNGAFIEMDSSIPDCVRLFPADDESGRGNHVWSLAR